MLLFWLGNFILQNHQLKLSQFFVLNLYLRLKRKTKSIWQVGAGGSYPQNSADSKVIPKPSTSVRLEIETDHLIEKITIETNKAGATKDYREWSSLTIYFGSSRFLPDTVSVVFGCLILFAIDTQSTHLNFWE